MSCAPSRSKILSRSLGSSSSIRYCKPEHPPPTTFTRKPLPGFSDESCLILETAFSDSEIILVNYLCAASLRGFALGGPVHLRTIRVGLAGRGCALAAAPVGDRRLYSIFG